MKNHKILMTPHIRQLVLGETIAGKQPMSTLIKLYNSLVEVLIQSVESTTRDVRELMRLLRIIWPFYLKPLLCDDNDNLLDQCCCPDGDNNESDGCNLGGNLSEILGQKVRPYIRRLLNECLLQPSQTMQEHQEKEKSQSRSLLVQSLPYYSRFLVLAAYLCQSNSADYDQKLYTNQRSGRRRRKKNNQPNETYAESLTHASSNKAQQSLKSEQQIPSFPLERLLSVFSSITNKYAVTEEGCQPLGSISIFAILAELCQLGYLSRVDTQHSHDITTATSTTKQGVMAASYVKYVCHLSKHEAFLLATNVKFPLVHYLAENL